MDIEYKPKALALITISPLFFVTLRGKRLSMRYGGLLPYAWVKGQPVLLLGREMYLPRWDGSRRWAPFGGGVHSGEKPYRAALREGYEETMGLFGTPRELARKVDRKAWKHAGGLTLLLPVKYDKNIPAYFRNFFRYAQACKGRACPEGWYEKTQIQWVPLARLDRVSLRPEFQSTLPQLRRHFRRLHQAAGAQ